MGTTQDCPGLLIERHADALQALEALRLGVVPAWGVAEYTVAREAELAELDRTYRRGRGCRVIWGDYGAGKTHLLDVAEQLAWERGFVTARVTLDPRENAIQHPLRLYRAVMASVRLPGAAGMGFESLFEKLADSPAHNDWRGARASRFFTPYLHALRCGSEEDSGWLRDYVGGDYLCSNEVNAVLRKLRWRGARVLTMSDFRTYGRMYTHLLGTLASWARDAGHQGLVLLFDEVEHVDILNRANQGYALEVLGHLAAVSMEREDLEFEPEDLYKGGQKVHRSLPLRFCEDQPLTTLFALTPLREIRNSFARITQASHYDLELAPLTSGQAAELVRRIGGLYCKAHPDFEPSRFQMAAIAREIERLPDEGHDTFRTAVRGAVFLLDALRFRRSVA